jgi:hypothetical protein
MPKVKRQKKEARKALQRQQERAVDDFFKESGVQLAPAQWNQISKLRKERHQQQQQQSQQIAATNNFNARVMRNFELAAPHDEEGKFAFSPYMARRMGEAASDFKNGQFGLRQRQTLSRESALRTQAQQRNQQLQQTNVQLRESLADSQQHIATVCTRVV